VSSRIIKSPGTGTGMGKKISELVLMERTERNCTVSKPLY
jgi:hypothetical protein